MSSVGSLLSTEKRSMFIPGHMNSEDLSRRGRKESILFAINAGCSAPVGQLPALRLSTLSSPASPPGSASCSVRRRAGSHGSERIRAGLVPAFDAHDTADS